MARIRSIKPSFAGDSKVARLSLQARLTFLLLLPEADDEGRMVGSSKRLAGVLYPNDPEIGATRLEKWLRELENEQMVLRYEVDGTKYLMITQFKKHQNPQHPTPSVLPPPPDTPSDLPVSESPSCEPHESFENASRNPTEPLPKPSLASVEGVELRGSSPSASSLSDERREAERIVNEWWETRTPKPVAKWIGVVKLVQRFLEAGHFPAVVAQALHEAPAQTVQALEFQLSKQKAKPGTTAVERSWRNILEGSDAASRSDSSLARNGHGLAAARALEAGT